MKTRYLLLMALIAALGHAQKDLPKDLPAYGKQPAVQPPTVTESKLPNGLTVWLAPQKGLPLVALRAVVLCGLACDPHDRPGISELLAGTLSQGTKSRTAKEIAEQIQAAGGDLQINADRDAIRIATSVLASRMESAADVISDVLRNASFPASEVAIAKRNLSDSLRLREAQPQFQANRALARALFGAGPYSVIAPTQESLAQMAVEDLQREFGRRFRPDQALIVAAGDFDVAQMMAILKEKLGTWQAGGGQPPAADANATGAPRHEVVFVARPNSVQTTLVLAAPGPLLRDPDYEAAGVANAIYGGSFTSRLVVNIREDKGYTYSPGSVFQVLRQAGIFRTQADVRNAVTGASLNEMMYELNRMVTTSPTDEELERGRRYLLGNEATSLQSRESVTGELSRLWVNGLGSQGLADYIRRVEATSLQDVDSVARKYFPASRMTIVAVGDETTIRQGLQPFGIALRPAAP
ncbi:MAG: insulinase family protein [Acidobacteria bacterium]|nr:insulinase family protein [Acidobacteriota bacterium]